MNMKQLRERVGLTQEAVAYKLGVSYSTVRNWENGRTIPTFTPDQTIKALSIYACNLNELDLAVRETRERKAVDTKTSVITKRHRMVQIAPSLLEVRDDQR